MVQHHLLADAVMLLHLGYSFLVLFAPFFIWTLLALGLWPTWLRLALLLHTIAISFAACQHIWQLPCPLTQYENWLRGLPLDYKSFVAVNDLEGLPFDVSHSMIYVLLLFLFAADLSAWRFAATRSRERRLPNLF